jgi:hypothetical protein
MAEERRLLDQLAHPQAGRVAPSGSEERIETAIFGGPFPPRIAHVYLKKIYDPYTSNSYSE